MLIGLTVETVINVSVVSVAIDHHYPPTVVPDGKRSTPGAPVLHRW